MRDPYLYEDADVLRNLLNIRDSAVLDRAEADITGICLLDADSAADSGRFDTKRLFAVHKHIFGDVYAWAGTPRTIQIYKGERVLGGDTVRYALPDNIEREATAAIKKLNDTDWPSFGVHETADIFAKLIAELWQVHPFREGNTRTVITFATQFAEAHGFHMDKTLLKESAAYVRDALAKASDGPYSDYSYLVKIFEDAITRG